MNETTRIIDGIGISPSCSSIVFGTDLLGAYPWIAQAALRAAKLEITADVNAYLDGEKIDVIAKRRGISTVTLRRLMILCGVRVRTCGGQQASHRAKYAARVSP